MNYRHLVLLLFGLIPTADFGQALTTGRVIDADTKKPISEAVVSMEGTTAQAKTNHLGYFQMEIDSTKQLTIEREGYETVQTKVSGKKAFQVKLAKYIAPEYEGGMYEFAGLLQRNIKYPAQAVKNGTTGSIYVSFDIDSLSGIRNIVLIKDIGDGCGEQVVRALKMSSKHWIPKMKRAGLILPVVFRMDSTLELVDIGLPKQKMMEAFLLTGYDPRR